MRYEFPATDGPLDPSWREPLLAIAEPLARSPRWADQFFSVDDFFIMRRMVRRGRPDVQFYKHVITRAEIALDEEGHGYRFHPPRSLDGADGRYRRHRHLRHAVDDLDLWLVPWAKPELAPFREGLAFEDRSLLYDRYVAPAIALGVDPFAPDEAPPPT